MTAEVAYPELKEAAIGRIIIDLITIGSVIRGWVLLRCT